MQAPDNRFPRVPKKDTQEKQYYRVKTNGINAQPEVDLDFDGDQIDISGVDGEYSNFRAFGIGKETEAQKKRRANVKKKVKKLGANINATKKRIGSKAKKFVKNTEKGIHRAGEKIKKLPKAIKKGIQNKIAKTLRKGILHRISKNTHGIATQVYPAIAPASEPIMKIIHPSYTKSSKLVYADLLKKWKQLGGNQTELNNAIISGSKKNILKNPYPTQRLALANVAKRMGLKKIVKKHSFDGTEEYYGVAGDGTITPLPIGSLPVANIEDAQLRVPSDTAIDAKTPHEDIADSNTPAGEETKLHGIRAFFAWLKNLFRRHKHKDNPFVPPTEDVAGKSPADAVSVATPEAKALAGQFQAQLNQDATNVPSPIEANNPVVDAIISDSRANDTGGDTDATNAISDSSPAPDDSQNEAEMDTPTPDEGDGEKPSGEDDTIMGINKTAFIVGASLLAVGVAFVIYKLATKGKGGVAPLKSAKPHSPSVAQAS